MAGKEATIFIIDQGASMGKKNNGRNENDLDFTMRYVWDKFAEVMIAARKTLFVGVIGLRTDKTAHALADDEGYNNISIMQELEPMYMAQLKRLQREIRVSRTDNGDAISAIILAIDMMEKFTKKLKYKRKIVLVTDGRGLMDGDDLEQVTEKLNEDHIELVVIGVDFDDTEFGFKEENKNSIKTTNEAILKVLVDKCEEGVFGTAAAAIEDISVPRVKEVRPFANYKGQLMLGDPEKYDTAMCIDIERYARTKVAKPPSASSFVVSESAALESGPSSHTLTNTGDVEMGGTEGEGLTSVKSSRTYKVIDESAPGGKRDVDREELASGYEYGRTAVHISESDLNVTKLETVQSFSIVGFVPTTGYERFFNMGESCVTIPVRTNEKARMALSSFVRALDELQNYAVARVVLKEGKDPQLLLLAPSIEPELECLIDVPLPFAEDVRLYRFPPLDRVITTSGATLTKHRNLPTDELAKAMSDYVDSMDLSDFGKDDEGEPTEYMAIEDTYSPVLHRINQAIRRRGTKPDEPVGPPAEILVRYSHPPPELVAASQAKLEKLIATADIKKVPPKAKGRRAREMIKPLSGLDVDSLLQCEQRHEISTQNTIPEFKQALSIADSMAVVEDAVAQMSAIVYNLISNSVGDANYAVALADVRVMREELANLEMPELFNGFVREFKGKLLAGDLGGDRREVWFEVRRARLGLLDKARVEVSDVTEEDAAEFYSMKPDLPVRAK